MTAEAFQDEEMLIVEADGTTSEEMIRVTPSDVLEHCMIQSVRS